MRYPVSEALDRYSILWLKRFFGCDVDAELEAFENYLRDQLHENWQLVRNSLQLGTCNALQWMLEECVSPFEDDECVAQAAIEIRRSNVQRVAAKNALAQQLGGGFQDQRVRYPGAEILTHETSGETRIHKLETAVQAIRDRNADACDYRASGKFDLAAFDAERVQREEEVKHILADADGLGLGNFAAMLHNEWVSACGPTEAELAQADPDVGLAGQANARPWENLPKHEVDDPSA